MAQLRKEFSKTVYDGTEDLRVNAVDIAERFYERKEFT